ncbi:MAG TPA: hypothetical protein VK714_14550 [Myxococcota bacterium]|nr:hypothetical protein [Myxococcota bacterium]
MARTLLLGLTVAELKIAIEVPPELRWRWPAGPLRRFASSADSAHVHVGVRVGRSEPPTSEALRYDSGGGIFDVAQVGRDWVIALRIQGRLQRLARFDAEFRSGEVVVDPESFYARERHYPLAYPLDEVIFLHRLAREGGLLLHACGVVRGREALLFSGPSGAGKTTIARLMQSTPDVRVLSDDRIAIRPTESGFRAHGTPWHGDAPLSLSDSASLRAIHLIHHACGIEAEPLAGAAGAAAVLGNAFAPFHDPVSAERSLDLAAKLAARVPILRLGFPKDGRVVSFAWGAADHTRLASAQTTSLPCVQPAR